MPRFEKRWQLGGVLFSKTFPDQMTDLGANAEAKRFWEGRSRRSSTTRRSPNSSSQTTIRSAQAEICTDSNCFQTFNSPHVQLVSVRRTPITAIDATGIVTTEAHFDVDAIVFATGFDALTGSLGKIDIAGRGESGWPTTGPPGRAPTSGWATTAPEPVHDHRTGQPAVLGQHGAGGRAHVDWIADAITTSTRMVTPQSDPPRTRWTTGWRSWRSAPRRHCSSKADSWYLGANVPGKPRVFMLFCGGFGVWQNLRRRGGLRLRASG